MKDRAELEMDACVQPVVAFGPRKCTSHAARPTASKEPLKIVTLTPEQRANVEAKERFVARCVAVLGDDQSVRDLALFFGVKRTTLHERMRFARTDLAPLPCWFEKLDRYEEFQRLTDEFLRTA